MNSWICLLVFAATPAAPSDGVNARAENAAGSAATSPAPSTSAQPTELSAPATSKSGDSHKESAANPKSARQLRKDMHDSLRSAAVETGPAREVAIRRLVTVYVELARDTQFTEDDRLAALRLVRNRLQKISEELTKAARKTAANKTFAVAPAANNGAGEIENSQASDPIKADLPERGRSTAVAAPARGGMQSEDDGDSLVDLIQRTIATQTWEANGGRGVIRYYAPGQALVVRQTSDVHDNVLDVIGQLRK